MTSFSSEERPPSQNAERTLNHTGFAYPDIGISIHHWLSSLPSSSLPVLDVGCAFGGHTIYALSRGRDVIALDMDAGHLSELLKRLGEEQSKNHTQQARFGRLVGCVQSKLPNASAVGPESVSSVLISEVLHFCSPGEPLQIFKDAFQWLQPGGLLVVTVGSSVQTRLEIFLDRGFSLHKNRTLEQSLALLKEEDTVLIREAPGLVTFPENPSLSALAMVKHLYLMSTEELEAMSRLSGFEVLQCRYYSPGKYGPKLGANESVILVARKPN